MKSVFLCKYYPWSQPLTFAYLKTFYLNITFLHKSRSSWLTSVMACRVVSLGFNHCNASSVVWRALSLRCSTKEDCCCRRILNKSLQTEIKDKETWHVVIQTTNNTSDLRVLFSFMSCTSSWWSTCRPSARSCPHLAPPVAPQSLHPSALLLAHTSVEKRILVKVNEGDHVMKTSQSHLQPTSSLIDHQR